MTASSGDTNMVFNAPRRLFFALISAPLFFLSGIARGDDSTLRTYFVGNSVTDTIRYGSLAKLAKSRGHTLEWGRDMIPGSSLSWLWEHPKDGFQQEPFGLYPTALSGYAWDALSLQPFDRHLDGIDGDLAMARNFIDLALKRSPDVQVYIYSRWPRKDKAKDGSLVLDFKSKWLRKYTGNWDLTEETRDYFETVVAGLRKAYEGKAKPPLMVPVGDVLLELHERMRAGKVPGFTDIAEVYIDGIHFNNVGSFVVGTTFYATLFRDDPKGMNADPYNEKIDPKQDRLIEEKLAAAIQDAVWTVVSKHPLAGVRKDPPLTGVHRIVFVGDSITYSGQFVEFIEAYLRIKQPTLHCEFLDLGLPSETVSGLSEPGHAGGAFPRPDLHERLDRVMAQTKPDLIVACYGMNDGIYHPFAKARFEKYQDGMRRLRERAEAVRAGVLHVTPPVFDPMPIRSKTLPAGLAEYRQPYEGYDDVLERYSEWLLGQKASGWDVVDVHGPMKQYLSQARQRAPDYRLADDGVHIDSTGHWLMARAILQHLGVRDPRITEAASGEQALAGEPNGLAVLKLVQQKQRMLKDAWLTTTGHKRPGMNPGLPLNEAQRRAQNLDAEIDALLGQKP
jgi:lysophospholipase L1-like esterase